MAVSQNLDFNNILTAQSELQPKPTTIASAATIAPTSFLTFISGTVALATITPPLLGAHMMCFIFTTATPTANGTGGNIKNAITPKQNSPTFMIWNPNEAKYYAGSLTITPA